MAVIVSENIKGYSLTHDQKSVFIERWSLAICPALCSMWRTQGGLNGIAH